MKRDRGMRRCLWWLSCFLVAGSSVLQAGDWLIVGPRALGMGGAGVAVTRGPLAAYWNPANLAAGSTKLIGVSLPLTASYSAPGRVIRKIDAIYDELKDVDFHQLESQVFGGTTPFNDAAFVDDLHRFLRVVATELPELDQDGEGLVASASGELGFQFGRFALSARAFGYGGVRALLDLSSLGLAFGSDMSDIVGSGQDRTGQLSASGQTLADQLAAAFGITQDQAEEFVYQAEQAGVDTANATAQDLLRRIVEGTTSGGTTLENFITRNDSGIKSRALGVTEIGLSYAFSVLGGRLAVGGTAKAMLGVTHTKGFGLSDLEEGGDVFSQITEKRNRKESLRVGFDVGATAQPIDLVSVGIVARNINQPKFAAVGGDYELDPQVRCGVALYPTDWLTLAADMDLTKNRSEALPGYCSQVIGGGAELNLLYVFSLRGGVSKNILKDEGLTVHFGLGVHAGPVRLEAAAAVSTETTKLQSGGNKLRVPDHAQAALMVEVAIDL